MIKNIYFDYQATTPVDPRVVDKMIPYFGEIYGNPHSRNHSYGWEAEEAVEMARENVANIIEAKNEYKNQFISSFNKINPVTFYQNEINCLAQTDYYAYRNYRTTIQSKIDEQIKLILLETWNEEIVGKDKYLLYISNLK